ncbi:MAG: hypothetical protein J2P57_14400 [Acidimicrobiaceae bacterium]|nr:hypothetical protein [Acidimicrobiaceae bacterium]
MSRTYKDIRLEFRAIRQRQIVELERARTVRRHGMDRARDRQQAMHDAGRRGALVMPARVVEGKAA